MNQTGFLESAISSLATVENSFLRLLNKSLFFEKPCSLKNVKIWAEIFQALRFEVKQTMPLEITGCQTCYFVLLFLSYTTLIKCGREWK